MKLPLLPVMPFCRVLCLLAVIPSVASAYDEESTSGAPKYIDNSVPWQEQESGLPVYPERAHLLEVDAGTDGLQYTVYLDKRSIAIGDDRVVRYTVVLESSTGVWNVSYEGLHCGERKYRRYAYGFDGAWQPLPDSQWSPVRGNGANAYRRVFYERYICDPTDAPGSVAEILNKFRDNWHEQM